MHILDIVLTSIMTISALAYLVLIVYGLRHIDQLGIRIQLGFLVDDLFSAPRLKLAAITMTATLAILYFLGLVFSLWTILLLNVVLYALSYLTKQRVDAWVAAH